MHESERMLREDFGHTRVVCSTLDSRGKSLTPESRIEMLDPRRLRDDCSEATHPGSAWAILTARPLHSDRAQVEFLAVILSTSWRGSGPTLIFANRA